MHEMKLINNWLNVRRHVLETMNDMGSVVKVKAKVKIEKVVLDNVEGSLHTKKNVVICGGNYALKVDQNEKKDDEMKS